MKAVTEYTIEEAAKMSATCKELFEKVKGTTRTARTYKSCKTSAYLEWSAKYLTHSLRA